MKKRAYQATGVKNVPVEPLTAARPGLPLDVGVDVGKDWLFVALRWGQNDFERPWKAQNPQGIGAVIERLSRLAQGRKLRVALEPTGTYGDPLRQALSDASLATYRVGPKAAHDYAEIFDGVPSQHDGKDAAIVAELLALERASEWKHQPASVWEQELAYWADWLECQQKQAVTWQGRLEGLLARHWPEYGQHLKLRSRTLLSALAHYGGPGPLAADGEQAVARLTRWSRGNLKPAARLAVLASAAASVGVRQTAIDLRQMREYSQRALAALDEIRGAKEHLATLAQDKPQLLAQAAVVGEVTACVLWVHLGDPKDYHCGEAYRKAMGLNLKERSSGRFEGQLKLAKRGPSQVRRWLYFSALRWVQKPPLDRWYARKKIDEKKSGTALAASLMRKLALALYQVGAKGVEFQVERLFATERRGPRKRRRRAS